MNAYPVYRTEIYKLPESELADYVENILKRCKGNPAYTVLNDKIAALDAAHAEFAVSTVAARNHASEAVTRKKTAKAGLLAALKSFANALEFYATSPGFVVEAGMKVTPERQQRQVELPAPQLLKVSPTGNSGEVLIRFILEEPGIVQVNAIEYAPAGGQAWTNGTYTRRSKIVLKGLPPKVDLQFRVRSIGTRSRVSAWTPPVSQMIL